MANFDRKIAQAIYVTTQYEKRLLTMASNFTSSFDYDDIPIFEGTERVLATIQLIVISLVSIALHGIFLLIIGSLCIAPNFALVILHVALAVHRLGYTLFPIKAHLILKLWMLKTLLSLVFFYFIVVIALTQTDLMGIAFLPSTMCLIIMDMQYSNILYEWVIAYLV
uniref:Transmembrane protein n=1 Tax=Heterorhabditis bacteriophora TaxID=37862 RepID=A0A1I7WQH5_HETBA